MADDIESFFHVLSVFALRFHEHGRDAKEVATALENYDKATYSEATGSWIGSQGKLDHMIAGTLPFRLRDATSPLANLLSSWSSLCKQHYATLGDPRPINALPRRTRRRQPAKCDLETSSTPATLEAVPPTTQAAIPVEVKEVSPLANHTAFRAALEEALGGEWPIDDKLEDQLAAIRWSVSYANGSSRSKRVSSTLQDAQEKRKKSRMSEVTSAQDPTVAATSHHDNPSTSTKAAIGGLHTHHEVTE